MSVRGSALCHEAVLYRDVGELVDLVAAPLAAALRDRQAVAEPAVLVEDPVAAFAEPAQTMVELGSRTCRSVGLRARRATVGTAARRREGDYRAERPP